MKTRFLFLSLAIAAALLIPASQTIGAGGSTHSVSPVDRISIDQPRSSGQWKAHELTVNYSYSKDQGQIDLSGNIVFANFLVLGYARLQDFRLGVIFLDANGKVIEETGLATNRGAFDPIPFKRRVSLPPNAASMAFSYQGDGIESGMASGRTSFSFSPVR